MAYKSIFFYLNLLIFLDLSSLFMSLFDYLSINTYIKMSDNFNDIVKSAYEQGILLDGCGLDERYYTFGAFTDYGGMDIHTLRCMCGYAKDNPVDPNPPTPVEPWESGDTYYGLINYQDAKTIDDVTEDMLNSLDAFIVSNSNADVNYSFVIPPTAIDNLNNISDEELKQVILDNAVNFVFVYPAKFGDVNIIDALGVDVSHMFESKEMNVNGEDVIVVMEVNTDAQYNLYDPETEKGTNIIINYTIKFINQ